MPKIKLGIYGGTFSPPHLGHVNAARSFVKGAMLDRLLIMPTFLPPHKLQVDGASAEDRLAMCKIAFADVPNTEISDFEIKNGGKSYTYLTLQQFSKQDVDLYFLCGTDMILTMGEWKHPEVIFKHATVCFVRRESDANNDRLIEEKIKFYRDAYSAKIIALEHDAYPASSTDIRAAISDRRSLAAILPSGVCDYIVSRGLYK